MGANAEQLHSRARVNTRVRTRTEVSRNSPAIPPPPSSSSKSNQRERSTSLGTTFVSTAVVPAPDSTEILSSLITSLTVLTDSARDQPEEPKESEPLLHESSFSPPPEESFIASDSEPDHASPVPFLLDPSDDEVAEAPVVGYSRLGPKASKKSVKERWTMSRAGRNMSVNSLGGRSAVHSPPALMSSQSVVGLPGVSHVSRPPSSATTGRSMLDGRQVDVGRDELDSILKAEFRKLFSSKSSKNSTGLTLNMHAYHDDDTRSTKTSRSKTSSRFVKSSRLARSPDPQLPLPAEDVPTIYKSLSTGPPSSRILGHLDPTNREDLGDHLIPSRMSSARRSPVRSSTTRPTSSKTTGSTRELQPLPSEDELREEEDDPTLRRIRELQRAREQRQTDREKEYTRSPRSKKKLLLSEKKVVTDEKVYGSPTSTAPGLTSKPALDEPPMLTTTLTAPDLGSLTAFGEGRASPLPSPVTPRTPIINAPKSSPTTNGRAHTAPPSPLKHKRVFSGSMRRSASLRRHASSDVKSMAEEIEAFVTAPRLVQKIRHPRTGRNIAFSEVGDPDGFTVLICPGMGLTRYVTTFYDEVAKAQKLRLLALDRPGIGDSDPLPDTVNPPLAWADDVMVICQSLNVQAFSLIAHSAGTIYALAIALKMPNYVRGKIHLLSPYVPQSQMMPAGEKDVRTANLPTSQKILSKLPAGFLKVANHRLLSSKSTGLDTKAARKKERDLASTADTILADLAQSYQRPGSSLGEAVRQGSVMSSYGSSNATRVASPPVPSSPTPGSLPRPSISGLRSRMVSPTPTEQLSPTARQQLYDTQLASRIWDLATTNSNPGTELIVCLESRRWIGFYYRDVTRHIIIHHGRLDKLVPLQNAQWLQQILLKSELRVLEQEDHNLMGNARVISNVLAEVGGECEELELIARAADKKKREIEAEMVAKVKLEREKFIRTGRY